MDKRKIILTFVWAVILIILVIIYAYFPRNTADTKNTAQEYAV